MKSEILRVVVLALDNAAGLLVGAGLSYYFHSGLSKIVGPAVYGAEEAFKAVYGAVKGAPRAAAAAAADVKAGAKP